MNSALGISALALALDEHRKVFPLLPRAKKPATLHGLLDATEDAAQIEARWGENSEYNLGVATGRASGFFALDIDGQDGAVSLAGLEAKHGALPETREVKTPRGRHFHFVMPGGKDIRNSESKIAPRIDVRGTGGYVVAPPSINADGIEYKYLNDLPPLAAPPWLLELIAAPAAATPRAMPLPGERTSSDSHARLQRRARIYIAAAEATGTGTRNSTTFRLAGHVAALVGENGETLSEPEITWLMAVFNDRCAPPLEEKELKQLVHSALVNGTAREPKPPRKMSFRASVAMEFALENANA